MKVVDCYKPQPTTTYAQVQSWDGGCAREEVLELQVEHRLEVRIEGDSQQGHDSIRMACTPDHLVELALGRLFADGFINGVEDVGTLYLNCSGTVATATLVKGPSTLAVPASSGGVGRFSLSGAQVFEDVAAVVQRFSIDTPMHRRTHGAHSCFVAVDGHVVFECEDIGRHNALDKAIGYGLRLGIDLSRTVLFTSGRTPSDVIAKTARAGVGVLVSASVPTDCAISVAQELGVALISKAGCGKFLVCSDPHGICARASHVTEITMG